MQYLYIQAVPVHGQEVKYFCVKSELSHCKQYIIRGDLREHQSK